MLSGLFALFAVGLVALLVLGVVIAVFGLIFGVAGFLLFKVAPVLLVGWIILKLVSRSRRPRQLSAADRRWLDG